MAEYINKISKNSTTYNMQDARIQEDLSTATEGQILGIDSSKNIVPIDAPVTDAVVYSEDAPEKGSLWWKLLPTLEESTWEFISQISSTGKASNYWSVGDCKKITLNGVLSDGYTANNQEMYVFIIGFDHDINIENPSGHTITFNGFKTSNNDADTYALVDSGYNNGKTSGNWFNMKNSNSNLNGWGATDCTMRVNIMPAIKAAMPSALQSAIKPVTKQYIKTYNSAELFTIADQELFLLAENEIFGGTSKAITSEGSQYTWFKNKSITTSSYGNNVRYQYKSTGASSSTCYWWERSPRSDGSSSFCRVDPSGGPTTSNASYSLGVSPAFCV